MTALQAFSAAHPLLTQIGLWIGLWCVASAIGAGIWIACFPAIRVVPQAPGRSSDRRKVS